MLNATKAKDRHSSADDVVAYFYAQLTDAPPATSALFDIWLRDWELVHGQLERKRPIDRKALSERYGVKAESISVAHLLFSIETYFVFAIRCLTYYATHTRDQAQTLLASSEMVRTLYSNEVLGEWPVSNFGSNAIFEWFLNEANETTSASLHSEFERLSDFSNDPGCIVKDGLLRNIYHARFPKQSRHALGAFYTPNWLAEYVIDQAFKFKLRDGMRTLDPMCGSGVFLTSTLNHIRTGWSLASNNAAEAVKAVTGFDINPLAVFAAKANLMFYLIANTDMPSAEFDLPVYMCDAIDAPFDWEGDAPNVSFKLGGAANPLRHILLTAFGSRGEGIRISKRLYEERATWVRFIRCSAMIADGSLTELPLEFELDNDDRNDLVSWLRIIREETPPRRAAILDRLRDALAPLHVGQFDLVVGNPPWVNWEYLPPTYRLQIQKLWTKYGLFDLNGRDKAFSKEDISGLATCVSADRYLAEGGAISFVVPESLFKSALNARGFRKFELEQSAMPLEVKRIDDFVAVKPFSGVSNRTAVITAVKGSRTQYPVPWTVWRKLDGGTISETATASEALATLTRIEHEGTPSNGEDIVANWVTALTSSITISQQLVGKSPYRARTGVFTGGANGVFYVSIESQNANLVTLTNVTERAKRKVEETRAVVEDRFVYPFLRGRDVKNWSYEVVAHILFPHTVETGMSSVDRDILLKEAPRTFEYFRAFEDVLRERKGFVSWERHFMEHNYFCLQRIGKYTFQPFKLVWRYISKEFICCVVEPDESVSGFAKPVIPQEKLMMIGFDDSAEAYFVCGVLSSPPVRLFIQSRMISTQIAPHLINDLAIPRFDPQNPHHDSVATACRAGHYAMRELNYPEALRMQNSICDLLPNVLPVSQQDVVAAQQSLTT